MQDVWVRDCVNGKTPSPSETSGSLCYFIHTKKYNQSTLEAIVLFQVSGGLWFWHWLSPLKDINSLRCGVTAFRLSLRIPSQGNNLEELNRPSSTLCMKMTSLERKSRELPLPHRWPAIPTPSPSLENLWNWLQVVTSHRPMWRWFSWSHICWIQHLQTTKWSLCLKHADFI